MLLEKIRKIDKKLNSVVDLLAIGEMFRVTPTQISQQAGAVFHTIVDDPEYQMGIATFSKKGDATEEHNHPGVTQYIVQARGRTAAFFEGGAYRIIDVGECCAIKPGEMHKFVSMADNSVQLWICIPAESGYKVEELGS